MFLDLEWPISRVCTICKDYASLVIKTISLLYDGEHDYRPPREWNFSHPPYPRDLHYSVQAISDAVNPSVESKKSWWKTRVNEFLLNVLNIWGLRSNLKGIWNSPIMLHSSLLYCVKFQIKIRFLMNCKGIQKESMTSCPPSSELNND